MVSVTTDQIVHGIKQRRVWVPLLGLAILVVAVISIATRHSDTKTTAKTAQIFTNWLKPSQEIKVGDYRYMSPCQVFPVSQAQKIFANKFNAKTNIVENYADKSLTADQVGDNFLTTKCTYRFNGEDGGSISLEAYPYYTKDGITNFVSTAFAPNDATKKIIDRFASANHGGPKTNQDFIHSLQSTQQAFNERAQKINDFINQQAKEQAKDLAAANNFDINAAVAKQFPTDIHSFNRSLAAGLSLQETGGNYGGAIEFVYKYDNAYYSLNYIPAKQDRKSSYDQYDNAFLKDITEKFAASYEVISHNVSNQHLNQSPAPTIIGTSDTYGNTKLLEACSVADGASYAALFGAAETQPVERVGYSRNAAEIVKSNDVSDKIKYDQCIRSVKNTASNQSKAMDFTLLEGPDAQTTTKWDANQKADDDDTVTRTNLQTNADSASSLTLHSDPTIVSYRFKVGTYVGEFYPTDGDNTTGPAVSQDAAVKAINVMVANLKRDIAASH